MNFAIYPAIRFINQLAFIISAVFGAMLVLSGGVTIGFLQAYLQYINQISEPISTAVCDQLDPIRNGSNR